MTFTESFKNPKILWMKKKLNANTQIPFCYVNAKNQRPGSFLAMSGYIQEPITCCSSLVQWLQATHCPGVLHWPVGLAMWTTALLSLFLFIIFPSRPSVAKWGFRACGEAGLANIAPATIFPHWEILNRQKQSKPRPSAHLEARKCQ